MKKETISDFFPCDTQIITLPSVILRVTRKCQLDIWRSYISYIPIVLIAGNMARKITLMALIEKNLSPSQTISEMDDNLLKSHFIGELKFLRKEIIFPRRFEFSEAKFLREKI